MFPEGRIRGLRNSASAAAQVKLWKQKGFAEFAAEYREEIEMAANSIGEAPNSIT